MGDLRVRSPEPNGAVCCFSSIEAHCWVEAEEATQDIIALVQPTTVSEERRRLVVGYVQNLIRASLGCEVFPFGSVPLKTYLPDGDIDLTAFGGLHVEEALANDVFSILEKEDQNRGAEFVVKDVQLIRAEVKLVKCLVQNIVVDISFNQIGGLCTLCFLEKVDRLIAKDHLFKRSIILIKAWCYYESRILGAHHGLISTYALETLVLYIFHLFHSSLNGPLAVLYKFLDYFSKFDWEKYCISLNGPVRLTSLPEIVAERPDNGGGDLLLSNDFLKDCVERFSSLSRGSEANSRTFPSKHLNIVDPLKENNNLGRSVSKGNFYRIRSAFTYGARKLGSILTQSEENLSDEIHKFFSNTLDRHGSGQRPDVQGPAPFIRPNGFGPVISFSGTESCHKDQTIHESESARSGLIATGCELEHGESLCGDMKLSTTVSVPQHSSREVVPSPNLLEAEVSRIAISEDRLSGDARDLATPKINDLTISKVPHAPHLYFSSSFAGNGEKRKESSDQNRVASPNFMNKKVSSGYSQAPADEFGNTIFRDVDEDGSKYRPLSYVPWSYEDLGSSDTAGTQEVLNSLSDLSGDFEGHIGSLNYGRLWLDCALSASMPPMLPLMLSQFPSQNPWGDAPWRSMQQSNWNGFPQANANGIGPIPPFYPMNGTLMPRVPYPIEDVPKPRGTGTYFPNTNHYRDRPLGARGRNPVLMRSPRSNGRLGTPFELNSSERSGRETQALQGGGKYGSSETRELPQGGGEFRSLDPREASQAPFQAHQGGGKYGSSEPPYQGSPRKKAHPNAIPPTHQSEKMGELPPFAAHLLPLVPPMPGTTKLPSSFSEVIQNPSLSPATPELQSPKPVLGVEEKRIVVQSYKLKDDGDFPPLTI